MSLYSAYDKYNIFSELGVPLETQEGVLSAATQRQRAFNNIFNVADADAAAVAIPSQAITTPNLFGIPNAVNGSIFAAHTTQAMTHSIRIRNASGTAFYVMVTDAATNRS